MLLPIFSGVSIRRIAQEAGCTSAVLYKHFDNLDHLITLSSVRFLEPYITEFLSVSERTDISSVQMDLYLWRLFIREAFRNRPYYQLMFFSDQREMLEDYVYEYFSLFPERIEGFDGLSASIIFSSNLEDREYFRLRRAANDGLITLDNARLLSRLTTAVFGGIFVRNSFILNDPGSIRAASDDCFDLIYSLFRKYVEPGCDLHLEELPDLN